MPRPLRVLPFVLLCLGLVGCDQATKGLARGALAGRGAIPLVRGVLELRHEENPGVAFSLLVDVPAPVRRPLLVAVPLLAAVLVVGFWLRRRADGLALGLGCALLLGGTVGNLIDRALRGGAVTDFIHLRGYSVFNLADVWLVAGVALLAVATRARRGAPAATI